MMRRRPYSKLEICYQLPADPVELSFYIRQLWIEGTSLPKYSVVKNETNQSPDISKFARLLKRVREWAAASGMSKDDIPEAIKARPENLDACGLSW